VLKDEAACLRDILKQARSAIRQRLPAHDQSNRA